MVLDSGAISHSVDPEIKDARFIKTGKHADAVNYERNHEHPPRPEDQKQLNPDHRIDYEKSVRHACKHLRTRQRYEQRIPAELLRHFDPYFSSADTLNY